MTGILDSTEWSTVHYPSAVFGTEKHGVFPFERFAFDALRIATEALAAVSLPAAVSVTFDPHGRADPWALNAWIRQEPNTRGYAIETTLFTPPVLLALCHRVIRPLFSYEDTSRSWRNDPTGLHAELTAIGNLVIAAANTCRNGGVGRALLELRDGGRYSLFDLPVTAQYFDAAVQFIVNHEAAHAYVKQFERLRTGIGALDLKAYEFLADLTATSWMYRKFIVNTPHTPAYRELREFDTHDEAIRANTQTVLESQLTVLAFLALSEATRTRSPVTLGEGPRHPHTMVRYLMQQVHFMTLVLSNYSSAFDDGHLEAIDGWWREAMLLLTTAGLLPQDTEDVLTDDKFFAAVRRAGELAETLQVEELRKAAPFLRQMAAIARPQQLGDDALGLASHFAGRSA